MTLAGPASELTSFAGGALNFSPFRVLGLFGGPFEGFCLHLGSAGARKGLSGWLTDGFSFRLSVLVWRKQNFC